ncbi:hypothetical protein JW835_04255 [bacterium]|nr:hypothetical protein [bacterium]
MLRRILFLLTLLFYYEWCLPQNLTGPQEARPFGGLSAMIGGYAGPDRGYFAFASTGYVALRIRQRWLFHQPVLVIGQLSYEGRPEDQVSYREWSGTYATYKFEGLETFKMVYFLLEAENFPGLNKFISYSLGFGIGKYHVDSKNTIYQFQEMRSASYWKTVGHEPVKDETGFLKIISFGFGLHFLKIVRWENRFLFVQDPGTLLKWGPMIYSAFGIEIRF